MLDRRRSVCIAWSASLGRHRSIGIAWSASLRRHRSRPVLCACSPALESLCARVSALHRHHSHSAGMTRTQAIGRRHSVLCARLVSLARRQSICARWYSMIGARAASLARRHSQVTRICARSASLARRQSTSALDLCARCYWMIGAQSASLARRCYRTPTAGSWRRVGTTHTVALCRHSHDSTRTSAAGSLLWFGVTLASVLARLQDKASMTDVLWASLAFITTEVTIPARQTTATQTRARCGYEVAVDGTSVSVARSHDGHRYDSIRHGVGTSRHRHWHWHSTGPASAQ